MTTLMVRDVMTRDVVWVRPDTPFLEIVDLMENHGIGMVPVLDRGKVVVGVVSEADLMAKLRLGVRPAGRWPGHRDTARAKATGTVARDLMSTRLATAMPNTWVVAAARRLAETGVRHLVVTDDLGRLLGVVSRRDLLKVFQRPDAELRDELLRTMRRHPPAPGTRLSVEVSDGYVTVTGESAHPVAAAEVAHLAEEVPGVVGVNTTLVEHVSRTDRGLVNLP
jgi:CBS domain-containing protein